MTRREGISFILTAIFLYFLREMLGTFLLATIWLSVGILLLVFFFRKARMDELHIPDHAQHLAEYGWTVRGGEFEFASPLSFLIVIFVIIIGGLPALIAAPLMALLDRI